MLPSFPTPEGHDEDSYLRELTLEGARDRYGADIPGHVLERIEFELGVIKTMGFSAYFLVVWDLVRYARQRGIRVGPGRGSAAGSCVAYCLRIVDIDPIRYDLLFERFLNPGRKQMPDIDMDFDSRYRGEMIKYAAERYGWDHVAQIVTFSTIKARAAVRDAARVLGYPYGDGDRIAKLMPPLIMGRDTPLRACLEPVSGQEDGYKMAAELRALYDTDSDAKRIVDVARGLEGLRRQDGIHAAAVVIAREPLTEYLPIQRKPEPGGDLESAPIVTQYEMHGVEELGLLKMDFLGLRNLDVLEITLELVERATGARPDIDNVPLDDPKTFDMLRRGDTRRRVPAGRRAGPRAAALVVADRVRGRRRARRALPARPDGPELAQRVRGPQERAQAGPLPAPRPRGHPRPDLRADDLPGAADARRAAAGRLLARGGRQPPQGDRQEDPRADREGADEVRRGLRRPGPRPAVRRGDLRHDRAVRRLLVQQVALRRLRLPRLPDRLPEGEPPGRVPRRAADQRQGEQGPDRGLPERVPPDGHRGARPRRERVGVRLLGQHRHRGPGVHPFRALRGAQRGRGRGRPDRRGARGRAVRSPTSTTSASASTRWR